MKLVVATKNEHKLIEIRAILKGFELLTESEAGFFDEVEETGKSFLENALLKAEAVSKKTFLPALADDSGLCVDSLCGAPGIYSARYASLFAPKGYSKGNRAFLLEQMAQKTDRRAHFCCAAALVFPDGKTFTAEGKTFGSILFEERGEGGFGYDALFFSDELQMTFAEAGEELKNSVSHRGRALKALLEQL